MDAEKRAVYDIYGKQGLDSGLEVGNHSNDKPLLAFAKAQHLG